MTSQLSFLRVPGGIPIYQILGAAKERSVLVSGVALGLSILFAVRYFKSPWRRLPPGPPGFPVIGNALQLVGGPWIKFSAWKKDYGMILSHLASIERLLIVVARRRDCLPKCCRPAYHRRKHAEGCHRPA